MYRREDDQVYGVLNDFDLARFVGNPASSNQRTGTRPFMSIAALRGENVQYYDELESLYYCLLTYTSRRVLTSTGTQSRWGWTDHIVCRTDVTEQPYNDWFDINATDKNIADNKEVHFKPKKGVSPPSALVEPSFHSEVGKWIDSVRRAFIRQNYTQLDYPEHQEATQWVMLGDFLAVPFQGGSEGSDSRRGRDYYRDVRFD